MADKEPAQPADPVLAGIDRLRETAKWLLGAYAAVGAALIAGLQLTSLGTVEDDARLYAAITLAAVALLLVFYAISKTGGVLAPVAVEESDLEPSSKVGQMVQATPSLLKGQATDIANLRSQYKVALTDYQAKRAAAHTDPSKKPDDEAYAHLMALHAPLDRLRTIALFNKVQQRYDDAKLHLWIATVLAAFCVIGFAWAANPTDDDQADAKAKESGPELLQPSEATVSIEKERESLGTLREKLGTGCNLDRIAVLVVGGTSEAPEVITLPENGCETVRFTVSDDLGIALPATEAQVPE